MDNNNVVRGESVIHKHTAHLGMFECLRGGLEGRNIITL